jgi:hypothetical protein
LVDHTTSGTKCKKNKKDTKKRTLQKNENHKEPTRNSQKMCAGDGHHILSFMIEE